MEVNSVVNSESNPYFFHSALTI